MLAPGPACPAATAAPGPERSRGHLRPHSEAGSELPLGGRAWALQEELLRRAPASPGAAPSPQALSLPRCAGHCPTAKNDFFFLKLKPTSRKVPQEAVVLPAPAFASKAKLEAGPATSSRQRSGRRGDAPSAGCPGCQPPLRPRPGLGTGGEPAGRDLSTGPTWAREENPGGPPESRGWGSPARGGGGRRGSPGGGRGGGAGIPPWVGRRGEPTWGGRKP